MFELHAALQADCKVLGDFPLSRLLLMNDANYPWLILVPRREGAREIFELPREDQQQLLLESEALCQVMQHCFKPDKMNIAALGNMVPQLHVHHIARYRDDPAWPKPVWGVLAARAYTEEALLQRRQLLLEQLASASQPFS